MEAETFRGCRATVNRIVFLLEEDSMRILLEGLLPRLFPGLLFQCVPHEGKQDLEKSIPRKLKAWREPGVRFVVIQDQDSADCHQVKTNLVQLCQSTGRRDVLVRVACRELEAWYIGEPQALKQAFPSTRPSALRELGKRRYQNPDTVVRPSDIIAKLIPEFQKRSGARRMAAFLSRENASNSFRVFIEGIERLWTSMQTGT